MNQKQKALQSLKNLRDKILNLNETELASPVPYCHLAAIIVLLNEILNADEVEE
jgi:hypothetical protein